MSEVTSLPETAHLPPAEVLGSRPATLGFERRRTAMALKEEFLAAPDLSDPRFSSADLLELLFEDSEAAQADDPRAALRWAGQAALLADRMAGGSRLESDARVRAWRLRANARRLLGDFEGAEEDLCGALYFLAGGSRERPSFHLTCGLLHIDRWRPAEALAHLHEASRLFFDAGALAQHGTCSLLAGLVFAADDDAVRAVFELLEGRKRAEAARHPRLSLVAGLTYARLVVAAGQCRPGKEALEKALELRADLQEDEEEGESLQAQRLEAAARLPLGEAGIAEIVLRDVYRRELGRGDLLGSTLAALDLSVALKVRGKGEQWRDLIAHLDGLDEVGRAFAMAAVESFWSDVREGWAPGRAASRAEAEFRRQCRMAEVPLGKPIRFA